jgi:cardiolipin synthase
MKLELLIDSKRFWNRLEEDINLAKKRVYLQTLSFEGDSVGRTLADRIMGCSAGDKRIIVDYYTKYVLSDKFRYSPKNLFDDDLRQEIKETARMFTDLLSDGTRVKFVNPVGPLFLRFPSRNHKKIIVIDDQIGYVGGINFSEHNFEWHDLMLRIEDPGIASFLAEDFRTSWDGGRFRERKRFGDIELHSLDGRTNKEAFEPIFRLMDNARKSIYVQSPYLSSPFSDKLREAADRGVKVSIMTPENNNKPPLQDYIMWEADRSGFDLRLYQDRMTHVKAMLIDEQNLIIGSCNFDSFSYHFEQELVVVVNDKRIISEFVKQVIESDNANSIPADGRVSNLRGIVRQLEIKSISRLSRIFNK